MSETRTYNDIDKCSHVLHDLRGGCSGCNYDVESIIGDLEHRAADRDEWRTLARELGDWVSQLGHHGLCGIDNGMACTCGTGSMLAKLREKEKRDAGR